MVLSGRIVAAAGVSSLLLPTILPLHIVRALPALGSVGLFLWCFDEYYALAPLLSPGFATRHTRDQHNQIIGEWYSEWSSSLGPLPSIIALPLALSSSARIVYHLTNTSISQTNTSALLAHAAGLGLVLAHMPFGAGGYFGLLEHVKAGKTGVEPLSRVLGAARTTLPPGQIEAREALQAWLHMHRRRLWVIDLPAAVCMMAGMASLF